LNNSGFTVIVFAMIAAVTVSAGGHANPQVVVDKSWPDQAYRVEWLEAHIPEEVAANVKIAIPVTVRNNGNRVWPASQVFVAYHWLRDDRLVVWDGERTRFPRDLRAGGRAALSVRAATPPEPGSYVLQLTLVHELVAWFENKGADTIIRPVVVRPPTGAESAECAGSRVTPCTPTL
jgi:hypothetical protein